MGYPMASHLTRLGETLVWNRTPGRAEQHAAEFGSRAVTLEETAQADVIFTCLPTSDDVEGLLDRLLPLLKPGTIWVDCTSGRPAAGREQAQRLQQAGAAFLDAPVSGGPTGAKAGTLAVMVGGETEVLERARPLIESFGGTVLRVGPVGTGFAVKAVNNVLMAVHLWATAEGFASLQQQGVDLDAALSVINASSGRSFSSENKFPKILKREFAPFFKLSLLAKDAGIALENVQEVRGSAPLLAQTAMLLRAAQASQSEDADHAELVKFVEAMFGHGTLIAGEASSS